MTQLAFDFDIDPVEPEWVPIVTVFEDVKAGRDAWDLTQCRDCGGKASAFRGGDESPPRHVSHWGDSHSPEKHDELIREQRARRAKWRAR